MHGNKPPSSAFRGSPAPAAATPSSPGLSINDIYYALFRHKWKIAICAILGFVAAFGASRLIHVPARSEAKLFIRFVITNNDALPLSEEAKLKSPDQRGETIINAEIQILTSLDLARAVAQAVGPERILGGKTGGSDLDTAAAVVRSGLIVTAQARSSVIHVAFQHSDPTIVQPVLREVIARYLKMHEEIHRSAGMVGTFLTQETDQLRARLQVTEEALRRATSRFGSASFADAKRQTSEQIARLEQAILAARAELAERSAIVEEIAKQSGAATGASDGNESSPIPAAATREYEAIATRVAMLQRREVEQLSQFTADSVRVQETRAQLKEAVLQKTRLEEEYPALARTVAVRSSTGSSPGGMDLGAESARLTGLKSRIQTLTAQLDEMRARAATIDQAEGEIVQLQRRLELDEANYRQYARSSDQSRINEALGAGGVSNIGTVQHPTPPGRDFSKVRKAQMIAAGAGLGLGLVWAFLIEFFVDRSVRRPIDIERTSPYPLFITVPRMGRKQLGGKGEGSTALAIANGTEGVSTALKGSYALQPFHETLRDRMISFFDAKGLTHKPKLVAVTSIGNNAGTSTTAAGLARSLSETGDGNVLLVDMTLGHQTAQQFHRGKPMQGLEETLALKDDRVQVDENLYVARGAHGEELTRAMPRQFTKLLPKLRASDFDYIIFDMPAVSQISITPRLAGFMDIVFMVAESEKTNRDALVRAGDMLTEAGGTVGVILNKNKSYVPSRLNDESLI